MGKRKKRQVRSSRKQISASFGSSLETYIVQRIAHSHLQWAWVGIVLVTLILVTSVAAGYFRTPTLFGNLDHIVRTSVAQGDYETARQAYTRHGGQKPTVLGESTEIESMLYPERVIEQHIATHLALLEQYPYSPEILLRLARLYQEIGQLDAATHYTEQARI